MLPRDLKPELFAGYPPEARKLAEKHIAAFEALPLSFLPNLLREVIDYDFKFPAERRELEQELGALVSLTPTQTKEWFQAFSAIKLSTRLEQVDWVNSQRSLWNSSPPICGPRISWMRFAGRRLSTPTECVQCTRLNRPRSRAWESVSSAKA